MEKNKEAYMNYICPHCFHRLDECICDLFPPYYLIFIDKDIQEHICILNKKGYITTGCCEGHMEVCTSTYIAFADNYFKDVEMPEGFKYDKKRRMVKHTYSTKKMTKEKMEEIKEKNLKVLLEWCKNLPSK